jgi:glycosidase
VHFFGNHDTTRFLTEAHGSFPRLKEALGLLATLRGTPELYSGDEIGMTGGGDPENRHDFPGGFASVSGSNEPSAYSASGRSIEEQAIFAWTSELFAARQAHPVLQDGAQQNLFADDTGFAFVRTNHLSGCTAAHDREAVLVVINKKPEAREVILPAADTALAGCDRFLPLAPASDGSTGEVDGGVRVSVPADSFALFSVY